MSCSDWALAVCPEFLSPTATGRFWRHSKALCHGGDGRMFSFPPSLTDPPQMESPLEMPGKVACSPKGMWFACFSKGMKIKK